MASNTIDHKTRRHILSRCERLATFGICAVYKALTPAARSFLQCRLARVRPRNSATSAEVNAGDRDCTCGPIGAQVVRYSRASTLRPPSYHDASTTTVYRGALQLQHRISTKRGGQINWWCSCYGDESCAVKLLEEICRQHDNTYELMPSPRELTRTAIIVKDAAATYYRTAPRHRTI